MRLKTFRGAKKTSGDGDVGRYCWDLLERIDKESRCNGEKLKEALKLWATLRDKGILPLTAEMGDSMSLQ